MQLPAIKRILCVIHWKHEAQSRTTSNPGRDGDIYVNFFKMHDRVRDVSTAPNRRGSKDQDRT